MMREMLAFAGKHKIEAKVEVMPMRDVNKAYEGMRHGQALFRYVLEADFDKKA